MLLHSTTSGAIAQASDLAGLFTETAAVNPERTALSVEGERISYRKLDDWSDAVAQLLRTEGVKTGDRVALRMPPGAEAIVAILAILKCGAAYVPLDMRNPAAAGSARSAGVKRVGPAELAPQHGELAPRRQDLHVLVPTQHPQRHTSHGYSSSVVGAVSCASAGSLLRETS